MSDTRCSGRRRCPRVGATLEFFFFFFFRFQIRADSLTWANSRQIVPIRADSGQIGSYWPKLPKLPKHADSGRNRPIQAVPDDSSRN